MNEKGSRVFHCCVESRKLGMLETCFSNTHPISHVCSIRLLTLATKVISSQWPQPVLLHKHAIHSYFQKEPRLGVVFHNSSYVPNVTRVCHDYPLLTYVSLAWVVGLLPHRNNPNLHTEKFPTQRQCKT